MWRVKTGVDLKELEKFGYKLSGSGSYYYKRVSRTREIHIWEFNREVDDVVFDSTTYSGYKYEGEYQHRVKAYTKDLQEAGLIEKVNWRKTV